MTQELDIGKDNDKKVIPFYIPFMSFLFALMVIFSFAYKGLSYIDYPTLMGDKLSQAVGATLSIPLILVLLTSTSKRGRNKQSRRIAFLIGLALTLTVALTGNISNV